MKECKDLRNVSRNKRIRFRLHTVIREKLPEIKYRR